MIRVLNLATGQSTYYDERLTPEKAVVNAEHQSRRDMNWWSYDYSVVQYGKSGRTVFCGDFAAHIPDQPSLPTLDAFLHV
jgi:hypothetical protein